ncbi:glycosyltransferase family 4 protein [Tumidithrix elongata RA019]|uniref:Glycosyltransferase family 4 protein n=1 Tax=Tumidithrix elongata BACA0141 TaxID=2716417 RepID=A0AAW9Q0U4_9CYAN|nr:glycosyltransferase family 4 protein [Tumidithrix elongata RA019]
MKVLQIGTGWFPEQAGGLPRVYYDCVQSLPQVGVEVDGLVTGSEQVVQSSMGAVQAFAPTESSLWQRWKGVRSLVRKAFAQTNYDLVASHFALYTFPNIVPISNQIGHCPLVTHFHGPWALESNAEGAKKIAAGAKWWLEKITYNRSKGFIVLSESFRQVLHQNYGVPMEQIYIVPGGINPQHYELDLSRSQARERLGWQQDRPIILSVRRLVHRMGLERLIAAIAQVKQKYPEVLLLIAGKGPIYEELQSQIEALGLDNHVKLLGFVPDRDLVTTYRAANFSIVPSIAWEGFGLILIESLAAGTPVLSTPMGGMPEVLSPLSMDLLLEGSSTTQIAQGIIEVLAGQRQLPSAETCRAYVRENYDLQAIATKIKAVYQQVLAQ